MTSYLLDAVQQGTLFIDVAQSGVLRSGYFYSPRPLTLACESFTLALSTDYGVTLRPGVDTVNTIVKDGNLIVVTKGENALARKMMALAKESTTTINADGVDGDLTPQDVADLVRAGKIHKFTRLTILDQNGKRYSSTIRLFPELFGLPKQDTAQYPDLAAGPELKDIKGQISLKGRLSAKLYAAKLQQPRFAVVIIRDMFGLEPHDIVHWHPDIVSGPTKSVEFSELSGTTGRKTPRRLG